MGFLPRAPLPRKVFCQILTRKSKSEHYSTSEAFSQAIEVDLESSASKVFAKLAPQLVKNRTSWRRWNRKRSASWTSTERTCLRCLI